MSNQYNAKLVADMRTTGDTLDADANLDLCVQVAAGSKTAKQRMIEGNMALVIIKVNTFLGNWPRFSYLRDDLTSAGFIGLVNAVKAIAEGRHVTNPVTYFGTAINRELCYLLENEMPIRLPHSSQRLAGKNGEPLEEPVTINTAPEYLGHDPTEMIELQDMLECCCRTENERVYVQLRGARHTFQEIANQLKMPVSSVHGMKKRLYARFLRKSGMKPK